MKKNTSTHSSKENDRTQSHIKRYIEVAWSCIMETCFYDIRQHNKKKVLKLSHPFWQPQKLIQGLVQNQNTCIAAVQMIATIIVLHRKQPKQQRGVSKRKAAAPANVHSQFRQCGSRCWLTNNTLKS